MSELTKELLAERIHQLQDKVARLQERLAGIGESALLQELQDLEAMPRNASKLRAILVDFHARWPMDDEHLRAYIESVLMPAIKVELRERRPGKKSEEPEEKT